MTPEVQAERDRCFKLVRVASDYITHYVAHTQIQEAIYLGWTPEEFISEIKRRDDLWRKEPKKAKKEEPAAQEPELLQITIAAENR